MYIYSTKKFVQNMKFLGQTEWYAASGPGTQIISHTHIHIYSQIPV